MGFRGFRGLGFRGLGFGIKDLSSGGLGVRVRGVGFRHEDLGLRIGA